MTHPIFQIKLYREKNKNKIKVIKANQLCLINVENLELSPGNTSFCDEIKLMLQTIVDSKNNK